MTDEEKKPHVHELHAAPFHLDRPWHKIDGSELPEELVNYEGPVMVLLSDQSEHEAHRQRNGIFDRRRIEGTITHWRLP
jgi:hypothetical protein